MSESGYYAWRSRPPSARTIRHAWLTDLIRQIQAYTQALDLLAQHEISIAHSSINKPNLRARYASPDSPYLLGPSSFARSSTACGAKFQRSVLIADESKEHELQAIDMVADLQRWGTGIVPGPAATLTADG